MTSGPAADNIRAIVELERRSRRDRTWQERLSERISNRIGTIAFVAIHVAWFVAWAMWNALAPEPLRFDPYPYGLLTILLSLEAILLTTFVLITQNRMSHDTDRRQNLDLQIDLLAEREMTLVLRMLQRIADHLGVPAVERTESREAEKLTERTDIRELMQTIERQLPEAKRRTG